MGFIFLFSFMAGILAVNFGKSILLENTGLLDEETVRRLSSLALDSSALFAFVLRKRVAGFALLAIAATTYLGLAAVGIMTGWYGFCAGVFLAAGMLRYGLKGALLALIAMLPQYLFYAPALYALLLWCLKTYRMIYGKGYYHQEENVKTSALTGRMLVLIGIFAVLLIGCAMESYVNPGILQSCLDMMDL